MYGIETLFHKSFSPTTSECSHSPCRGSVTGEYKHQWILHFWFELVWSFQFFFVQLYMLAKKKGFSPRWCRGNEILLFNMVLLNVCERNLAVAMSRVFQEWWCVIVVIMHTDEICYIFQHRWHFVLMLYNSEDLGLNKEWRDARSILSI